MKIEIEDRGDDTYLVEVDKQGSPYHGENICFHAYEVMDLLENIIVYDM